jgi:hypothetical protein
MAISSVTAHAADGGLDTPGGRCASTDLIAHS